MTDDEAYAILSNMNDALTHAIDTFLEGADMHDSFKKTEHSLLGKILTQSVRFSIKNKPE